MAQKEFTGGRLFDLYARYVGEPRSRTDVYGYWTFILGYLVGLVGVLAYLTTTRQELVIREVAIALAAIGLPLGLLGIVLMLPVKQRGTQSSIVGAAIAFLGVAGFIAVYPSNWVVGTPDYSPFIITVYTAGVAVIGGVASLVPILTGERSLFAEIERELEGDYPQVMVGQAMKGALFAVYQSGSEWTWRLVEQNALAASVEDYLSRLETEQSVERIQELVKQAGLMEIKHAAFRLYEADDGWRWLLMRDDGSVAADSGEQFEDRDAAADSVSYLKEYGPDAPVVSIQGAAFDLTTVGGRWKFRLLAQDRTELAESASTFAGRDEAEAAIDLAVEAAADAGDLAIARYGVELFDDGDQWRFRLLDTAYDEVATSTVSYDSRSAAESAVYDLLDAVGGVSVMDASAPAYDVYDRDGWAWRLMTPEGEVLVRGPDADRTLDAATNGAKRLKDDAAAASIVRIEDADFEYFRTSDGWRWRLVTPDREVLAESAATYGDQEAAAAGVEDARTQALSADLIEFEEAAFQLYESESGGWRWRLIDEDGNVMADSGEEHETRDGAAGAMMTLKEHAPDADLIEIETAAFEFFQNDAGDWNWRLVDETGQTTTEGPSYYSTKTAAREAMDLLVDEAESAEARAMEQSVFQVYTDDDEWRFRFVHPDGTIVAESETGYSTRDEAETAIEEDIRQTATTAPVHVVGTLAMQLVPENDRWRWRLIDEERDVIAESTRSYTEREEVADAAMDVREHAGEAAVFELRGPTFQLLNHDGWRFRLVDEDGVPLAAGTRRYEDRAAAADAMDRVRRLAPKAGLIDFENAAFEVRERDGVWRWRLIDEDEHVIASGAEVYESEEAVREAIAEVTAEVEDASILEIDTAAFELHEDEGEWRWRLIDEDGNELAASLQPSPTRAEAREAMDFVKAYAADAVTSVAE